MHARRVWPIVIVLLVIVGAGIWFTANVVSGLSFAESTARSIATGANSNPPGDILRQALGSPSAGDLSVRRLKWGLGGFEVGSVSFPVNPFVLNIGLELSSASQSNGQPREIWMTVARDGSAGWTLGGYELPQP